MQNLERLTMDEYIKREAAVKSVLRMRRPENSVAQNRMLSIIQMDMLKLPASDVAPVVHWVLTDEKLPPEGQDVLCWYEYFRYGAFNRMYQTYGIGFQFNGNWGGEVANGRSAKVLAYMPLPEPPKMDGGDNDDAD